MEEKRIREGYNPPPRRPVPETYDKGYKAPPRDATLPEKPPPPPPPKRRLVDRLDSKLIASDVSRLVVACRLAKVALEHAVPSGCWSLGPKTGDLMVDHIICPGCAAIDEIDAALAEIRGEQ